MQAERELLVKQVFPELRRMCADRLVTFTEVDLRWGITEEQAAEGKVLPICLEEIHRSRPYFIGLLGERYGSTPEAVPPEVISVEPWIQEHVGARTSVTELEILHGVLNSPAMAGHAFFYFRDPHYVTVVPEENRGSFTSESTESAEKLRQLKDRIRRSGLPVFENYADPAALAAAVRGQFIALIDQLYPQGGTPSLLDQEARGHEAHARGKLLAYVPRPKHTAVLDAFASSGPAGTGLVVTGDSGGGKTALLADWVRRWQKSHPGDFVFQHYFGTTPESSIVLSFLSRLLGELKRRYNLDDEIPTRPDTLREALPLWLARTTSKSRIVLVLDALNAIEGSEADRRLVWLPQHFPSHVRVVASSLDGVALVALRERGWVEHALPLPDASERDGMIAAFLGHYRKTLREDLRARLSAAPGSANPLFLRTVLEELRQFGSFEQLPVEVARYLEATSPDELLRLVLRRWQKDFDAGRDLVRRSLRHLWAARQGLAEVEWLELLANGQGPLPRQTWAPLFFAMEPHLAQRAGLFAFGHDFLRLAVQAEFLTNDNDGHAAHLALADYFERQSTTLRKATELPWQLLAAEKGERLRKHLLDIPLFLLMHMRDENELRRYWIWLGEEKTMGGPYVDAFNQWATANSDRTDVCDVANKLAAFLFNAVLYTEAEPLIRRTLAIAEKSLGPDHPDVAIPLNNLAQLLQATNRLAEAEPLMRRALTIWKQNLSEIHPKVAQGLNNLAQLLQATDRLVEAEPLLRRALNINESILGPNHARVAICLNNLAQLLNATNRLVEAEPLLRRALDINESMLGPDHPSVALSLTNLAQLLETTNRPAMAEPLVRRALEITKSSLGPDHPRVLTCLNNLAQLLEATNQLGEAEPLHRQALAFLERNLGPDHPDVAAKLNKLAKLLQDSNRLAEAESLYRRALAIGKKSLDPDHPDVAVYLNNLAFLLRATNRLGEAEPLYRHVLVIGEKSLGPTHPDIATYLNNLAQLLIANKRLAEGEPLLRRALAITEQSFAPDHPNVAGALTGLAALFYAANRLGEAEPLMKRAAEILLKSSANSGHPHPHLQIAVGNYTQLLQDMGRTPQEMQAQMNALVHAI